MAAWNAEDTIEAAIRSVLNQTWQDLELAVVDDGSTDSTAQVVSRIADPRLRYYHQQNAGPSAARNRAFSLTTGGFVACIDADDIWLPDKVASQLEAFSRNANAGVAYGWTGFVDADLRPLHGDSLPRFEGNVYRELIRQNFIACGSNSMMRRGAMDDLGGFAERLAAVEDWDLHLRLASWHEFVCVPKVVVYYRQRLGSLSSRVELMDRSFQQVSCQTFEGAPPGIARLRSDCEASFYEYLTYRALQTQPSPQKWILAARYCVLALLRDPLIYTRRYLNRLPFGKVSIRSDSVESKRS